MARSQLKRLLRKKRGKAALLAEFAELNGAFSITDQDGDLLFGDSQVSYPDQHAIVYDGTTYGWVHGDSASAPIGILLGRLIGNEIEKKQLADETLELYRQINLVYNLSEELADTLDAETVAHNVLEEAQRLIMATHGAILVHDEEAGQLSVIDQFGGPLPWVDSFADIALSGKADIVNNAAADERFPVEGPLVYAALKTKRSLLGAIVLVGEAAGEYRANDLKLLVTLSAQAASGIENALLHESLLQEEVIRAAHERDLEAAARIQANTLPRRDPLFPNHPQVDVYATVEPAKEVGGDFFDAFALDGQHICILVGDVAGKGMPAALFMVRSITLLRMSLTGADSFESVLPTVNQLLCENNEEFMFVTLFLGMLDVTSGKMTYMNGGHNRPFFLANGEACELLELPAGILVGVNEEADFEVAELTFQPGDTLVVYTDGVTEAENAQHEQFAEERTCEVLEAARDADMTTLVKSLQSAIVGFTEGVVQFDDITIMGVRYQGNAVE